MSVNILAVVMVFAIPILMILMIPFIILAKGIAGNKKDAPVNEKQRQMVQEIYSNLERMESRIESLETILVGEYKHEKGAGRSPMDEPPPFR